MFSPEPVPVLVADAAAAPELAFEAGGAPGDRVTSGHRQDGPAAMTHAWDPVPSHNTSRPAIRPPKPTAAGRRHGATGQRLAAAARLLRRALAGASAPGLAVARAAGRPRRIERAHRPRP